MLRKYYKLVVDNELIPIWSIEIDSSGKGVSEKDQYLQNITENFTKVIDISNIDWIPLKHSRWDGKEFSKDPGIESLDEDSKNKKRFAFIDKNRFFLGNLNYDPKISEDEMMIALFLSNPIPIIDRISNV